jgi:PleD family two-component response regulator
MPFYGQRAKEMIINLNEF